MEKHRKLEGVQFSDANLKELKNLNTLQTLYVKFFSFLINIYY